MRASRGMEEMGEVRTYKVRLLTDSRAMFLDAKILGKGGEEGEEGEEGLLK